MKINNLAQGRELVELTIQEAWDRADVYDSDSGLERDLKLAAWIGGRRHRCIVFNAVTYSAQLEQAVADGIEILIIKESQYVSES